MDFHIVSFVYATFSELYDKFTVIFSMNIYV